MGTYQRKMRLYLFTSIVVTGQGLSPPYFVCHSLLWLKLEGPPLSSQSLGQMG